MKYIKIDKEDAFNGDGLRTVVWFSGCSHHCFNCQNPHTWDTNAGIQFDNTAKKEIFNELSKDYLSGVTFTGGDPLNENNLEGLLELIKEIRILFPNKTIWLYTGYTWEEALYGSNRLRRNIVSMCDVLIDGRYVDNLRDITLKFRGSSNQRIIDVKSSLKETKVVLYTN